MQCSDSFFKETDKRGYAIVQCIEGETVSNFDNINTGGSLQELYDETCEGLIQFKHETPIKEDNMYKIFKNSEGVNLEDLKMY